jgi:hypothetical protein
MDKTNSVTMVWIAIAIAFVLFIIIALPKIIGDEERSKKEAETSHHRNLIVLQPSLPATQENNVPTKPEIDPHQQILGPGGTQWIYQ